MREIYKVSFDKITKNVYPIVGRAPGQPGIDICRGNELT